MSRAVRPNAAAEAEFRSYVERYEKESAGLGAQLLTEIQAAIDLIAEHPAIGEKVRRVRGDIRRVPLRHFPFLLVYRERTDHLEIVALAHTSRRPTYWRGRLK